MKFNNIKNYANLINNSFKNKNNNDKLFCYIFQRDQDFHFCNCKDYCKGLPPTFIPDKSSDFDYLGNHENDNQKENLVHL